MSKILTVLVGLLMSSVVLADKTVEINVKKAFQDNINYTVAEDVEGVLSTVHTQSLSYLPTKDLLVQLFGMYKLKYEILDYKFINYDGELAYVRVKQRTTKVEGPTFQNNEMDLLQVYKPENGVWKIWSQANMQVEFLN